MHRPIRPAHPEFDRVRSGAASEIETRLERNGFDSAAIDAEVFTQAQQAFGLFDQMMQLGQHRRIMLLREIVTRREFENVLEKSGGAAKVDRKPSFGPVSSSMNSGFGHHLFAQRQTFLGKRKGLATRQPINLTGTLGFQQKNAKSSRLCQRFGWLRH